MLQSHNLFHSIHQLSRQLTKHTNEVLRPFGLYSAQWSVLFVLKTKGNLTQSELCEYLSVEAPPMTRTIQRLVKQGYVEQIPGEDKRKKSIQLSSLALTEFPKWEEKVLEINDSLLRDLNENSQDQLYILTSEWIKQLRA
jgi:MarR family transcriptional regulator, transcriptional regulator for hemolysin